ncbi:hypothetical protein KBD20_00545 [Candidatus Saccharibacteria bacterium]|nr:hypothetical protein [Candidatus Saccharibacteria bacterium]
MTTGEQLSTNNTVDVMRDLLTRMHYNDTSNLDEVTKFLALFFTELEQAHDQGEDAVFELYEQLSIDSIGLDFWDGTFDEFIRKFDEMGGRAIDMHYPDLDLSPAADWQFKRSQILQLLEDGPGDQEDEWKSPEILYRNNARFVLEHFEMLAGDDPDGESVRIISNKDFLKGLVSVFEFQDSFHETSETEIAAVNGRVEFIVEVLQAIGYAHTQTIRENWFFASRDNPTEGLAPNLIKTLDLECERPGSVKLLSEFYGIRNFSRYPTEMLIEQFDAHTEIAKPYGIIIGSVEDHNGALNGYAPIDKMFIRHFHDDVKPKHILRVCEAADEYELRELLDRFSSMYGTDNKIDFALVEAHGSARGIRLSQHELGVLMVTSKLSDLSGYFNSQGCMILNSCSTGVSGGIAQRLSEQLQITVMGPLEDTGLHSIEVTDTDDGVVLVPEYGSRAYSPENFDPVKFSTYRNGIIVSS